MLLTPLSPAVVVGERHSGCREGGFFMPLAWDTRKRDSVVRFLEKIDFGSGCWEWTASRLPYGYGSFGLCPKRLVLAHRFAYELMRDPIPEGLQIDHLCRNPGCVNPWHMEPVTARVNTLRGNTLAARHARATHCPQGHPYDEANTRRDSLGRRSCRACQREWNRLRTPAYRRDYRARRKAAR